MSLSLLGRRRALQTLTISRRFYCSKNAALTLARNSPSITGLRKKAVAPAFMALLRTEGSSLLVIMITRLFGEIVCSRLWTSSPLILGIKMSRMPKIAYATGCPIGRCVDAQGDIELTHFSKKG